MRQRVQPRVPHFARARLDQLVGDGHFRCGDGGVERGLAELGLGARLVVLEQARADVLAQLGKIVEAGVDREVVVDGRAAAWP